MNRKTPRSLNKKIPSKQALPRVAFLGLGAMGGPMAARLARKGFPLAVWNRTAKRASAFARSFADSAARVATSPRDAAAGADLVVTMMSDAAALASVLGGEDGLVAGLSRGALVLDMSTIGRAAAKEAAAAIAKAGARFVDAPVSGTIGPAERGELVALVGGDVNDVAKATPVLHALCKQIVHAGGVGQGQALKVIVNGVGVHHLVAFTSMLVLGERAGLAREVLVDAFTSGAFASPSYLGKRAKVLARDYSPEFSLALTRKDAVLNMQLQDEVGLALPAHREIAREVDEAVESGLGAEDLYGIERYFMRGAPAPRDSSR